MASKGWIVDPAIVIASHLLYPCSYQEISRFHQEPDRNCLYGNKFREMKIFISYRRDDSAGYAGRLFDFLAARFGSENVFMDIDTIEPGDDFRKVIANAVKTCDVVLVMIGRQWLTISGPDGQRRLDDPGDWVRVEIATALANPDVRVIPVLVRGASMPREHELPEDLKELAWRNAHELSDSRFQHDAGKLVRAVGRSAETQREDDAAGRQKNSLARYLPILLGVIALGLVIGMAFYGPRFFGATATPISPALGMETPQAAEIPPKGSTPAKMEELALLRTIPGYGQAASAALSPDGKIAAAGYYDGMIKLWSADQDTLIGTLNAGTTVSSLGISKDNQLVAAGLTSAGVKAWRRDGTELPLFEGLKDTVYSVAFSPDGEYLAGGDSTNVIVWRITDGTVLQTFGGQSYAISRLVFSPDSQSLASAARGCGNVNLWQMGTNALVRDFEADCDTAAVIFTGRRNPGDHRCLSLAGAGWRAFAGIERPYPDRGKCRFFSRRGNAGLRLSGHRSASLAGERRRAPLYEETGWHERPVCGALDRCKSIDGTLSRWHVENLAGSMKPEQRNRSLPFRGGPGWGLSFASMPSVLDRAFKREL